MPILNVTYPDNNACAVSSYARCDGKSCTWTVPAGVTIATFEVWGGGGGGGNRICGSTSMCCNQGQAGAGGGYSKVTIPVEAGQQYVLCAGNGGQSPGGDDNGYYGGSANGGCCNGCPGGTSYVTGPAPLPASFCATGAGYSCGDGNFSCQAWCGWNNCRFGRGCNGQVNATGGVGVVYTGSTTQNAMDVHAMGGAGGGPGGGPGGVKVGNNYSYGAQWYSSGVNSFQTGGFPGGGGVGGGYYSNCGCCYAGSPGGAGLVRVTY